MVSIFLSSVFFINILPFLEAEETFIILHETWCDYNDAKLLYDDFKSGKNHLDGHGQHLISVQLDSHLKNLNPQHLKNGNASCIFAYPNDIKDFFTVSSLILDNFEPSQLNSQERNYFPQIFIRWPLRLNGRKQARIVMKRDVLPSLQNRYISLNFQIYFVFPITSINELSPMESGIVIWESFQIKRDAEPIIQEVGAKQLPQILRRRGNFHQGRIIAIAAEDKATRGEVDWNFDLDKKPHFVSGSAYNMFKDLRDTLNFSTEHKLGDWLSQYANRTLKGKTFGYLSSGLGDIMISQTVMLPHRAKMVQYLQPSFLGGLKIFVHEPPASAIRDMYLAPFTLDLWKSLITTWLITFTLMLIFQGLVYKTSTVTELTEEDNEDWHCEIFLWVIATITQQGWYKFPESMSLKILTFVASLCALILHMAYTASIVSVLSIGKLQIKNLNEFLSVGDALPVFASSESSTVEYFLNNLPKTPTYSKLNQGVTLLPMADGVRNILNYPMAFISYGHLFYLELKGFGIEDKETCEKAFPIELSTNPQRSGMIVPKNSSFVEIFSYKIMELKERGFISRYNEHHHLATSLNCMFGSSRHKSGFGAMLGIQDTFSAYLILISGYCLAIIALIFELVVFKFRFKTGYFWQYLK